MNFYQALQLSPFILKNKIKQGENPKEKQFYRKAMIARSFFMVAFSMGYILLMTAIFGPEQSTLSVVLLCILLSLRFVDFGYRVEQGIAALGIVFLILLFSPQVAIILSPGWKFICHFFSLLTIFFLTSYERQLGNPSLYSFCYVFLVGTVPEKEFFGARMLLMLVTYLFFSLIYFLKHRRKHQAISFYQRVFDENIGSENNQFLVSLALGISLFFLWNDYFPLERFMWAGFAFSSLIGGNHEEFKSRSFDRILGVIIGSFGFFFLMSFLPSQWLFLIGPIGGFTLGFATTYRNQTIINCFGALFLAQGIYGVETAVKLRVWDNLLGVLFAVMYFLILKSCLMLYQQVKERSNIQGNLK